MPDERLAIAGSGAIAGGAPGTLGAGAGGGWAAGLAAGGRAAGAPTLTDGTAGAT